MGKDEASAHKKRMADKRAIIDWHLDTIFLLKCFGDALAFVYLDKHAIKHSYFDTEEYIKKPDAGFLTGKEGLVHELSLLNSALNHKVPAVLCDITNTLRYGDVCLLGMSDPKFIEAKKGALGSRGKRQIERIAKLEDFFDKDEAVNFREQAHTIRKANLVPEVNYRAQLNECILKARADGASFVTPEEGLFYLAVYDGKALEGLEAPPSTGQWNLCALNDNITDRDWAYFYPFVLTITDYDSLMDFVRGKLRIYIGYNVDRLCSSLDLSDWEVSYHHDALYSIRLYNTKTNIFFGVGRDYLLRIVYDCVAPSWFIEHERALIAEFESDETNMTMLIDPNDFDEQHLKCFGFPRPAGKSSA